MVQTALFVVGGAAWSVAYIAGIVVGFSQRTYAIPALAIVLNLAWEGIYTWHYLTVELSVRSSLNALWVLLDLGIFATLLMYGGKELGWPWGRCGFGAIAIGALAIAFAGELAIALSLGWSVGARYSSFLENVLMSGLFILMYVRRGGGSGQSLVLGWSKAIGTGALTLAYGMYEGNLVILVAGCACAVLDVVYILLLSRWRFRTATRH